MTYDVTETSRHEASPVEIYRFTHGATAYQWTSAEVEQSDGSETFDPIAITRSEISQSQEDHAGTIDVRVPRDNPVAALFIPYMPSTPVGLTITRKHRLDGDEEFIVAFVGKIMAARYDSAASEWVLTCAPVTEVLRRTIPIVLFSPQCNYALYSTACGVDKEAFKVTGTVSEVSGDTITSTAFGAFDDGYFNAGYVQRGDHVRFVVDHVGNVLTLMNPFTDLDAGNSVDAFPGCNRLESHCGPKFSNLVNHLGFQRIPTRNPFDSSLEY